MFQSSGRRLVKAILWKASRSGREVGMLFAGEVREVFQKGSDLMKAVLYWPKRAGWIISCLQAMLLRYLSSLLKSKGVQVITQRENSLILLSKALYYI